MEPLELERPAKGLIKQNDRSLREHVDGHLTVEQAVRPSPGKTTLEMEALHCEPFTSLRVLGYKEARFECC